MWVELELTPRDRAVIHENYKTVQGLANRIAALRKEFDETNPLSQFLVGARDGAWASISGTAGAIMHPIETLQGIRDAVGILSQLSAEDLQKICDQLTSAGYNLVTTRDGVNSIPYGAGYVLGMVVTEIALGKGAGAELKAVKGIPAIERLVKKAENAAPFARIKLAEAFSDEAAAAAAVRARRVPFGRHAIPTGESQARRHR